MTANPNTELLEGMQCPNTNCGSYGPFVIRAESTVLVSDDGTDEISNAGGYEWDDASNCNCRRCDHTGQVKDFRTAQQPLQITIGKYNVCMDVDADGDLQLRVYPIDRDGIAWDHPVDTFNVLKQDVDLQREGGE